MLGKKRGLNTARGSWRHVGSIGFPWSVQPAVAALGLFLILGNTRPCRADDPLPDDTFQYRGIGVPTATLDFPGGAGAGGAYLVSDPRRLELTNRRSWYFLEHTTLRDLDAIAGPPPTALAYIVIPEVTFIGPNPGVKFDYAALHESVFFHANDPASLVLQALPGNQIVLHWLPDRRYSYYTRATGVESRSLVPQATIERAVNGGAFTELATIGVAADASNCTYTDTDNIQLNAVYKYRIRSQGLAFSDEKEIAYTSGAATSACFWIKSISGTVPAIPDTPPIASTTTFSVSIGSYQPGLATPCPVSACVRKANKQAAEQDELPALMTVVADGGYQWTYSYDRPPDSWEGNAIRGGYAFRFVAGAPYQDHPFFNKYFTSMPNNRITSRQWATYQMNPALAEFALACIEECDDLLSYQGPTTNRTYDGIFGDTALGWPGYPDMSEAINVAPRTEELSSIGAYQPAFLARLSDIHGYLGTAHDFIVNGTSSGHANRSDGAFFEAFAFMQSWHTVVTCREWLEAMHAVRDASLRYPFGTVIVSTEYPQTFAAQGYPQTDEDRGPSRLYVLGSFMLLKSDNLYLSAEMVNEEDHRTSFYPEWQIDFGTAPATVTLPPVVYGGERCREEVYGGTDGLLTRSFANSTYPGTLYSQVIVNFRDYHESSDTRLVTPDRSYAYRIVVDNEKEQVFDGGRFWTEPLVLNNGQVQVNSGTAEILVSQPIASPLIIHKERENDVYLDGTDPRYFRLNAYSWNNSELWMEIDASAINGGAAIVLRDNGAGADVIEHDHVYTSPLITLSAPPSTGIYYLPIYVRDNTGFALYDELIVEVFQHAPKARYRNKSSETGIVYEEQAEPYSAAFLLAGDMNDQLQDLVVTMKGRDGHLQVCWDVLEGVPRFTDGTTGAFGVERPAAGSRGISVTDYNNDGRADLFVAHATDAKLYHHNSDGSFTNYAAPAGLATAASNSWVGAWESFDGDPLPSVLIGRWGYTGQDPTPGQTGAALQYELMKGVADAGVPGGVRFVNVTASVGLTDAQGAAATAVTWMPIESGAPKHLAIGNLTGRAKIYRNEEGAGGSRHFVDITDEVCGPLIENRIHEVSAWATLDYEPDGDQDMIVGRWDPGFGNICVLVYGNDGGALNMRLQGIVGANTSEAVSGLLPLDYDLDGDRDLLVLPGEDRAVGLWSNRESWNWGLAFTDITGQAGLHEGAVNGCAAADYNGDGALELYLGRPYHAEGGNTFFYCATNVAGTGRVMRNGLRVRVVGNGVDSNKGGTGVRVKFATRDAVADPIVIAQHVDGGSGRGTQASQVLYFGTGAFSRSVKATVTWPNGRVQVDSSLVTSTDLPLYTITEPANAPSIVSGSVQFQYAAQPGGGATWTFCWRTPGSTNPLLDRVVVYDPAQQPGECQLGSFELRGNQLGVTVTVEPSPLGGFQHTLVWEDGHCVGYSGCSYRYKVYSKNGGQEVASAERSFSLGACLE